MEHYGTLWNIVMMVSHSVSREGRFCWLVTEALQGLLVLR
jgi:hypothetical protein